MVLALCALAGLAACRGESTPRPESGSPSASASAGNQREVRLVAVTKVEMARTVRISGTLAADEQVTLAVKVGGRLASVLVDVGTPVKKDQAIAQVETVDYKLRVEQAEGALAQARAQLGLAPGQDDDTLDVEKTAVVRQARATVDEARANVERARTGVSEGITPAAQRDAAEAAVVRAESGLQSAREEVRIRAATVRQRRSEVRLARQQLADTMVKSPLDGVVQKRLANPGEFVATGGPVAEIVRIDPLRMRVSVPERDAIDIRAGQSVRVAIEGDPKRYEGVVARLAPAIDAQNRSLLVEADIKNPGGLRPGSFANAEIVIGSKSVPTVPATAIVRFAGIEKVLVVDHGKAVEKTVTTGKTDAGRTEIVKGLSVGDAIVELPGSLQQGHSVRVVGGP
jgi:HlyD family secretion protein